MDELTPLVEELAGHPIAFLGGFCSGLFRLNLNDDPIKSWLEDQGGQPGSGTTTATPPKTRGPQTISID